MTIASTNKPNWTLALGMPLLVFIGCICISISAKFKLNNELLSNGVLADLLITAPLLYFLAIRKTAVAKITVIRIFIAGILMASVLLNAHSNPFLQFIKTWVSPAMEVLVIAFILRKFYLANKKAKANKGNSLDFLMHCRAVLFQVTGSEKAGNIISSEIAVMYYAFFSCRNKSIDYKTTFSSYKENGITIVLLAILSIFLIETAGVHFLLSLWNATVAWVLTVLSLYTCIQLFAHVRAIKARPILINATSFEVHNGLAGDAFIHFENIQKIEFSNKKPADRTAIKISLLNGLENHNIVVHLKTPIAVTKVFGIKKQADTVLFFVDKPTEFVKIINTQLSQQ
jgi:hypothetical protein